MTSGKGNPHDAATSVAVAAALLAPFLTFGLRFRQSLVAQGVLTLSATLVLLAVAFARRRAGVPRTPSRPVMLGVALCALAATQGGVVALLRGNDLSLTAGQVLAMGLLPLAAVGALGSTPPLGWPSFAAGVVGGTAVGTLIQLAVTGPASLVKVAGPRMMLPNALSVSGFAPMALFLALALAGSRGRPARAFAWGAIGIIAVLILGSRIRSQWLVLPLGLAAYLAIVLGRVRLFSRRVAFVAAPTMLFVFGATAFTAWWWTRARPNLVMGVLASGSGPEAGTAVAVIPEATAGSIRVSGTLTCQGTGFVWIAASGSQPSLGGDPGPRLGLSVAGAAPATFLFVLPPRAAGTRLLLRIEDPGRLRCTSQALTVDEIAPSYAARLIGHLFAFLRRPPDPGAGSTPGTFAGDASIGFRIREMSAVLSAIRGDPWATWIFGHGLGATFTLDTRGPWLGYDNRGNIVRYDHPNYIHNFYLFLPFKLGVVGTLEVLAALALFVCAAVRGAAARPLGSPDRCFLAAAAAAWVTYIAWSVAAPQILDFRLAPFWGVVAALTASPPRGGESDAGSAG